ncbi:stage II sporulation protein E [Desulforamulus hydrothermalis]|uniref:Phosphoprotein phosphatase n=1 Tax=Desulforamulus hydrothermalis Lam5 = DSM 18033 TaxID=1121428 RepID=K8EJ58_9FIRM|nr:stage II sporulation protein E [Desulforamulus hydrothermalis]CCO08636.1 Phosphoprotein phosphatase [Desulforamulus hydrothermalis Lam5 = DSM 18033]SHH00619.1 stage II sporulation protein E [Desulforamulus hydrothermalis Lam5 = DSM 18033]
MFERTDVYTYQRAKQGWQAGKEPYARQTAPRHTGRAGRAALAWLGRALAREQLLLCLAGFFLGRVVLLGELSPCGISFLCAVTWTWGAMLLPLLSVLLGLLTVAGGAALWSTGTAVSVAFFILLSIQSRIRRPWLAVPGLAAVTLLTVKSIFICVQGPALYPYITAGLEAVMAGVLTFLYLQGLAPFMRGGFTRTLSGETLFCLLVLLAGIIAGTGGLAYATVSLRGVLSRFVILLAACSGGAGVGAAAGALTGVIPGLAFAVAPLIVGAYSFAGTLAGAVRGFGKPAVAGGFLLGNILLTIYAAEYSDLKSILAETAVATLLFLLFPAAWQAKLQEYLPGFKKEAAAPRPVQGNRLRELTVERIRSWASVFNELARSFAQVSSTVQQSQEDHGLQQLFGELSKKVCDGCALYRTCWERDLYRTCQNMLDMLSVVELQGKITIDDLSDDLKKRCARLKEMSITLTCLYDTYKVNNYWHRRLLESRELVSEQLKGIAQIMENMSGELEFDAELNGEIDEALRSRFHKLGIPVEDVYTLHKEDGLMEVGVVKQACHGEMACRFTVAPVVSKVVGRNFNVASTNCQLKEGEDKCSFKLYPALKYILSVGVAKVAKDGQAVCGDSHAVLQLKEGRMALLLSDGMGTGVKAAKESGTIISLLEHLLESGFGQDLAVKTVNSIMMLRSAEETFSTVDLTVVDLYTGHASFLKIGAVPSYILRGRRVTVVKANSLPVGVVENLQFAAINRTLAAGDLLVMVSDGVLDAYRGSDADQDRWMSGIVQGLGQVGAQEAAERILQAACSAAGGGIPDDMAVITARLQEGDNF